MSEAVETPVRVQVRGAVMVTRTAGIVYRSETVALLTLDLVTKRAAVSGVGVIGGRMIALSATNESHPLHHAQALRGVETIVDFPEFANGWDAFAASSDGRYTVRVTLVKEMA